MAIKIIKRRSVPENITLESSMHPVLQRVYAARDVKSMDDIDYSLAKLYPYDSLTGIDKAVSLLQEALINKKRILIVADFDTDGATSCALAIRGLGQMGAEDIVYVVPNRFEYGYGLTPEIVDIALDYDPDLLITVDNGISSIVGVKHAKENGVQVLITDHHLPSDEIPEADAIVNPQLSGDRFPSKNLAGVGVVFYVLLALRAKLKQDNWFDSNNLSYPNLSHLLDIVALGTVADVVPLDKNNRSMVAYGLKLIRNNKSIIGITALLKQANRSIESITASDLGFAIAPRLNAAGRLTDMSLGIECLITDDEKKAREIAAELDELNKERRQIQDEMQAQALIELENDLEKSAGELAYGICLFNQDWHQGVVGILAAKVKERFNRPVIVFANESEDILKGSARSISGLHIRDLLEEITRIHPDLILSFGGHAMAAGLTIKKSHLDTFKNCFDQTVQCQLAEEDMRGEYLTDGELNVNELGIQLAYDIQSAGPWGQTFPEPLFDGVFKLIDKRIVGGNHLKLKVQIGNSDKIIDAIVFNKTDEDWEGEPDYVNLVYRVSINNYLGRQNLQLVADYIEPVIHEVS